MRRGRRRLFGMWLLWRMLRMRGESGRGCLMQLSRTECIHRSRLIRSFLRQSYKRLAVSTVSLSMFIDARMVIRGSAPHLTVRMLTKDRRSPVKITEGAPQFRGAWNPGEEVNANAAIHLQHRDDREPTGPESAGRMAV